jgi:hypothetical protein
MIMLGLPWRCSSRTQALARVKDSLLVMSYTMMAAAAPLQCQCGVWGGQGLRLQGRGRAGGGGRSVR